MSDINWTTLPRPMQRELEAVLAGHVETARAAAIQAAQEAKAAAQKAQAAQNVLASAEAQLAKWTERFA